MVVACREKAQQCAFSVPASRPDSSLFSRILRKTQQAEFTSKTLLRRCRLHAILAGFGMGASFYAHIF